MTEILIALASLSLFVVIGYYFHCFNELKELMQAKYIEDYESIEKPSLFLNSTLKNNYLFFRYLVTKAYKKHNDEQLTEVCQAVLALLALGYVLFFVLAAMFVLNASGVIG